jgi:hypothetical protein
VALAQGEGAQGFPLLTGARRFRRASELRFRAYHCRSSRSFRTRHASRRHSSPSRPCARRGRIGLEQADPARDSVRARNRLLLLRTNERRHGGNVTLALDEEELLGCRLDHSRCWRLRKYDCRCLPPCDGPRDLRAQAAGWCGRLLNPAGRHKRLQPGEDVCGDGAKDAQAHPLWSRRRAIHDTVESLGMKPLTDLLEHRPLFPPRYSVGQAQLCKNTVPREISDVTQADSVAPQLTRQTVQRLDLVLSEPAVPLGPYGRLLGCEIDTLDDSSTLPAPVRGRRRPVQRIAVHRRVTQPRTRHGHARHSQIRHPSPYENVGASSPATIRESSS